MGSDEMFWVALVVILLLGLPLAAVIASVVALVQASSLRRRVAILEQQLAGGPAGATAPLPVVPQHRVPATRVAAPVMPAESATAPVAAVPVPGIAGMAAAAAAGACRPASAPAVAAAAAQTDTLEMRFGSGCLARIGALAIVIGVGFFFQYAIDNNWLGPVARVLIGLFWGCGFIVGGEFLRLKEYAKTGLAATGAGLAILYFSTFAAYSYYQLIEQLPAFLFMALLTIMAVGLAVRYDARTVAAVGLLGGMLTPVMLSSGRDELYALAGYLALLDAGFLLLAHFRNWQWLNCLAFFGTAGLLAGWAEQFYCVARFAPALTVCTLFSVFFLLLAVWHQLVRREKTGFLDLLLILANAAAYYGAGAGMIDDWNEHYTGIFTLAVAAVYLAFAAAAGKRLACDRKLVTVGAGLALTFLSLVFPMQFDDEPVLFAWTVEALLLFVIGMRLQSWQIRVGAFAVGMLALGRLVAYGGAIEYLPGGAEFTLGGNLRCLLSLAFIACAYAAIGLYRRWQALVPRWEATVWRTLLLIVVQLFTLWTLALENSDYFACRRQNDPGRQERWHAQEELNRNYFRESELQRELDRSDQTGDAREQLQQELVLLLAERGRLQELAAAPYDYRAQVDYRNAEQMTYSLIFGGYAVLLLLAGLWRRSAVLRLAAVSLFVVTIGKVFLVDLSALDTIYRIISFIVLGFILLGVSLLYTRFRRQINAFVLADGGDGHA